MDTTYEQEVHGDTISERRDLEELRTHKMKVTVIDKYRKGKRLTIIVIIFVILIPIITECN